MTRTFFTTKIPVIIALVFMCVSFIAPLSAAAETLTPRPAPSTQGGDVAAGTKDQRDVPLTAKFGQFIGNMIITTASAVTWAGGKLLDLSISTLVIGMGTMINTEALGGAIDSLWTMIRDICNLVFIFGFVYIGIRTIIDSDSSSTKSMLAQIIIGALLINFSLFIVKFVIDASNYLAVEIYKNLLRFGSDATLSAGFAEQMGLSTYYKAPDPQAMSAMTLGGNIAFYVLGALIFIMAGFVFAAGAVLIMIRFVALVFIMIFSPILFAATVFPRTAQYAEILWSKLISYSFFAPVYLLLLIISFKMLGGVSSLLKTGSLSAALSGAQGATQAQTDLYAVILNYGIVILFLVISLQVAKQFGIFGAEKVIGTAKQGIGAMTSGLVARAGRATIGRGASALADNKWLKLKDNAGKGGFKGMAARAALTSSRTVADSSLDARKIGGAGKALGIGEGRKGGYDTVQKEITEKEMKFAKSLGEVDDDDEKVAEYKGNLTKAEKELAALKNQLSDIPRGATYQEERDKKRKEIEDQENQIKELQEMYGREKNRRVLGSAENIKAEEKVLKAKNDVSRIEGTLKQYQKDFATATSQEDIELGKELIEKTTKELTTAQKEYKKQFKEAAKNHGFAGVVQNSGKWSWLEGRLAVQNHVAGEEMRETFEKKIKKSKDDKRHEELVDAAKAGAKKDDH